MSDDKTPDKYKPVNDPSYRGVDPDRPLTRFRDKKNRKGPRQETAEGTDFNPFDPSRDDK
jgi:hypothetical protein